MTTKCPACGAVMRYAESANVRYCPNCGPLDAPFEVFEDLMDEPDYDYSSAYWLDTDDTNRPPCVWGGDDEEMIE